MEQDDSWLTAPSLLVHLLMERPSPAQACLKQNKGSKYPSFKLNCERVGFRQDREIWKVRKYFFHFSAPCSHSTSGPWEELRGRNLEARSVTG